MRIVTRKVAALVLTVSIACVSGCGWVGSDSDTSGPGTSVPKPGQGPQGQIVVEGRPWRRGRWRSPKVASARWARRRSVHAGPVAGLEPRAARAIARSWARAGEFEHASIHAFVELGSHLRAHGAPAELVERCEAAAADERDHTSRCFALASRYAGRQVRPGRSGTAPTRAPALTVLARESILDGIVNEGVAALLAAEQWKLCTDPVVAESLAVIARDEAAHAELAWSILEWCVAAGGDDVRRCVASTRAGLASIRPPEAPPGIPHAVADAHGRGVPAAFAAQLESLHDEVGRRLDALMVSGPVASRR